MTVLARRESHRRRTYGEWRMASGDRKRRDDRAPLSSHTKRDERASPRFPPGPLPASRTTSSLPPRRHRPLVCPTAFAGGGHALSVPLDPLPARGLGPALASSRTSFFRCGCLGLSTQFPSASRQLVVSSAASSLRDSFVRGRHLVRLSRRIHLPQPPRRLAEREKFSPDFRKSPPPSSSLDSHNSDFARSSNRRDDRFSCESNYEYRYPSCCTRKRRRAA